MHKIISFPPLYFFSAIVLSLGAYFLLPTFHWIDLPYRLTGLIMMIGGWYIVSKSSTLFHQKNTTFYLEEPSTFVQTGFYQYSRNPMYLGSLILIAGLSILLGNLLSLLAPLMFYLGIHYLCIPPEETIMEQTFGQEYLDYQKKVRRWL